MLTDAKLRAMRPGDTARDTSARGDLGLEARRLAHDLTWYATYSSRRRTQRIALGVLPGLKAARDARDALRDRVAVLRLSYPDLAEVNDIRAMLEADDARRKAEAEASAQRDALRSKATLGALMAAYVEDLQARKKVRWKDVQGGINKHIINAFPGLAAKPAADVTLSDCLQIVRRVVDAGHIREAARIRSYLRAAYTAAIAARQRADGLPALADLGLENNPAANVATLRGGQGKPGERALSLAELQAYWRRIQGDPLLVLHLASGGQRLAQLARATIHDLDRAAGTLLLRDPKGRRETPRLHLVPLVPEALAAIDAMAGHQHAPFYVFTVSRGAFGATYQAVDDRLKAVMRAMVEAQEAIAPFTLGDIRRTVETRLAALRVGKELRGHLQSHGLGGVQDRHYDRHDYLAEKLATLDMLMRLCRGESGTVTPIAGHLRASA